MIAIVLTTHAAYLPHLEACVASIEPNQYHLGNLVVSEKVLVLDGPGSVPELPQGWRVLHVQAGNPNPARNWGLDAVRAEWVIHWDGDNIMPDGYAAAMARLATQVPANVGFIYPKVDLVNEAREIVQTLSVPPWDYWTQRGNTYIDTSSLWRVQAIRQAGGWSFGQVMLDDWELSLRITALGWTGSRGLMATEITQHDQRRSRKGDMRKALWTARSVAIVTLWSPKSLAFDEVMEWYHKADFPPHVSVYWVDNSDNAAVGLRLRNHAHQLLVSGRVESITIIPGGEPYTVSPGEAYTHPGRHQHVARLYNTVIPRIREALVLFLEDDNVPPLDGLQALAYELPVNQDIGGVGGCYESKNQPGMACFSTTGDVWTPLRMDEVPRVPGIMVAMMGGGFALYRMDCVRQCLPFRVTTARGLLGWDANLGRDLGSQEGGYKRLLLHGGVRVAHKFER